MLSTDQSNVERYSKRMNTSHEKRAVMLKVETISSIVSNAVTVARLSPGSFRGGYMLSYNARQELLSLCDELKKLIEE